MLVRPEPLAVVSASKPVAVVADLEGQSVTGAPDVHGHLRRLRVLLHVLERLEDAEVHGRLDVLRVALHTVCLHRHRHCRFPRLRVQRHDQSLVSEQRRVDAASQVAQCLQCLVGVMLQLLQRCDRLLRSRVKSIPASPSFTLSATRCCCAPSWRLRSRRRRSRSCALTRRWREARSSVEPRLQIRGQPDVLEHQSGLVRQIVDELLLDRCQRLAAALADAQRAEQLALDGAPPPRSSHRRAQAMSRWSWAPPRAIRVRPGRWRQDEVPRHRAATRSPTPRPCPPAAPAPSGAGPHPPRMSPPPGRENSLSTSYGVARCP